MPFTRPRHLNLEEFPNSAYASELRRQHLVALQFESPLEEQYRDSHLQRVRLRARLWFSVNFALSLLYTVDGIRRAGLWDASALLHLGALLPCATALLWLSWGRGFKRFYMTAAWPLLTVFTSLLAAFVARALGDGHDDELAGFTVDLIALFFFAGLLFWQALIPSAVALLVFLVTALEVGVSDDMLAKSVAVLGLSGVVGAIVHRDIEQSSRQRFLEGALISELAARDGLTGLMNRRAFDEHLMRVWQHALRDQRPVAVMMIDIDHFKRYNDMLGHQGGDAALRDVARVVQGFARRPLDLAARFGGEEFAIILYDLAPAALQEMAAGLRQAVQNIKGSAPITVSVGVGMGKPTPDRTPQGVLQLADEALYAAKQAGRNRVCLQGLEEYRLLDTGIFKAPVAGIHGE